MHTDTSPTAVGDRMRPLNRRILRKHLIVDGVVAGVAVVIASLVTAFVFWAAKRLHRWLPETDVHIDGHAFSIDSLPEAVTSNGRTVAILFVGVIATGALILTACVHGCLGAATVRTYLGAGLTRREFFGMHIRASLSNTAAVASFGLAVILLQAAVAGRVREADPHAHRADCELVDPPPRRDYVLAGGLLAGLHRRVPVRPLPLVHSRRGIARPLHGRGARQAVPLRRL